MFKYTFMQNAFIIGIVLGIALSLVGILIVLKRMSMIGDSLSHVSMSGVTLGLLLGFNPIIGALVACVVAALSIEVIRKKFKQYGELSIAIIMSLGVGISGVLLGFVNTTTSVSSFLFGSILAISSFEFYLVLGLCGVVFIVCMSLYRQFMFLSFDENAARLSGINTDCMNFIFMILCAVVISITSRIVGVLIVSSMMVIPVATAMQVAKSYLQTMVVSMVFAVGYVACGLSLSYYAQLKPGGSIVMVGVSSLLLILVIKAFKDRFMHK